MGAVKNIKQNTLFLYEAYVAKNPTFLYYASDNQLKSLAWAINKVVYKKIPIENKFAKKIDKLLTSKKSYFYKFSNPKNLHRKEILSILLGKKRFKHFKVILAPYLSKYVARRKKMGLQHKKGTVRRDAKSEKNKQ